MSSRFRDANLCTTCVYNNTYNDSNVHIAKDRGWFTEYHPFLTYIRGPKDAPVNVLGVGVVEIPVKKSLYRTGANAHGTMMPMEDAPGCNQVLDIGNRRLALLDGRPFHLEQWGLSALIVSGYPRGPRSRPAGVTRDVKAYVAAANWPLTERQRWNLSGKASKAEKKPLPENVIITLSRAALTIRRSQPDEYTSDEKEWLKKRWGNEYSFLQAHGLNIYKDEDREEGIRIVRSLMSQEKNDNQSRGTTTKWYYVVSPFSVWKACTCRNHE